MRPSVRGAKVGPLLKYGLTVLVRMYACGLLATVLVAEERGDAIPPVGRYKALIVAVQEYRTGLPALRTPAQSCTKLAEALGRLHYEVTFWKNEEATPATRIIGWLKANAAPNKADLCLLVLAGHGVRRDGRDFFLTGMDKLGEGGLDLAEVNRLGAEGNWPLVGIVDCCRTDVRAPTQLAVGGGASLPPVEGGSVFRGPVGESQFRSRTWLFSTHPGELAADRLDLISALANGLQTDPESKRFLADPWFLPAEEMASAGGDRLSLFWWLYFGVTKTMLDHEMRQQARIVPGIPDLRTSVIPGRVPPPTGQDVGLMELWRPQHGDYECRPSLDGFAIDITVPAEGTRDFPWIGGYVEERGTGFDTTGKALFAELIVAFSSLDPWGPSQVRDDRPYQVSIGLDAKFIDDANRNFFVTRDSQKSRFTVDANVPTWCKIPLAPGQRLNYFAVTDIPRGGMVVLRRLVLGNAGDERHTAPVQATATANLLARWWVGDPGQLSATALRVSRELVGAKQALRISQGSGWQGGVLGPPVWVGKGDTVEMVVENLSASEAYALVEIKQKYAVLGALNLRFTPGISTQKFLVKTAGLADYFAVTKPTADLRFYLIELHPSSPKVALGFVPGRL